MDFEKYCKTAIKEYPRLCAELQKMTEKVAKQIPGATVSTLSKKLTLTAHENNALRNIGVVDVAEWKVTTKKGSVVFIPDGLSIGVTGRIRVETKNKNPFFKDCIFTAATEDDADWCLVTLDSSTTSTPLTEASLLTALQSVI